MPAILDRYCYLQGYQPDWTIEATSLICIDFVDCILSYSTNFDVGKFVLFFLKHNLQEARGSSS